MVKLPPNSSPLNFKAYLLRMRIRSIKIKVDLVIKKVVGVASPDHTPRLPYVYLSIPF
uniref:Uncharacterized protein n=1 Tax=Amphimedon queenslandica TaxID=400682 RepID=A0A1X7VDK6_AMPQE